jgi:hypothetical protein
MLLEMSKRILDFDYQLVRIFGHHIFDCDQLTEDGGFPAANGVYDIIICHREGVQDRFDELKTYTKPTTHLIIDTTVESGNIDCLLDTVNHICKTESFRVTLIIDTDMSDYLENNKVSFECIHGYELAFFAHTNQYSDSKLFTDYGSYEYTQKYQSYNGSIRENRVLLLLELLKRKIQIGEGQNSVSFLFYASETRKFSSGDFDVMVNSLKNTDTITHEDVKLLKNFKSNLPVTHDCSEQTEIDTAVKIKNIAVINIVTENTHSLGRTEDVSKYITTFTEKTIKPFLAGQIPIFIGPLNLEKELRKLGFDLFDDLIDYSFESEKDAYTRLKLKMDEFQKILDTDISEYRKIHSSRFDNNKRLVTRLSNRGYDIIDTFIINNI